MATQLTVIGSLNYDLVTYTPRVPDGGETITANLFETHTGGKGFNEALALGRLLPKEARNTHSVRMIGKVGDDSFGKELLDNLAAEDVDLKEIETVQGVRTGVATILVEENGENRILITGGANDLLKPSASDMERYFPKDDGKQHFVMLQNEFPYFVETISWLKENRPSYQIAYNPSPIKHVDGGYLKNVDLLIVNEIESKQMLRSLGQVESLDKDSFPDKHAEIEFYRGIGVHLAKKINHNEHSLNLVIVTLGSTGVVYVTTIDGELVSDFIPSNKVAKENVVDTTGAGDTFFGSVVSQLSLDRLDYKKAIQFAAVASSLAIQKKGAGESIPRYEDVIGK